MDRYYRGYNPRPPEFPRVQNGPQRNNRSQRIIFSREELFLPSISPNPYGHQELHQVNANQALLQELLEKRCQAKQFYQDEMDEAYFDFIEERRLHFNHLRVKQQALNWIAKAYSWQIAEDYHRIKCGLESDVNYHYRKVQERNQRNKNWESRNIYENHPTKTPSTLSVVKSGASGALAGAEIGAELGCWIGNPVVGMVIGGAVGGLWKVAKKMGK
ncbi:uncharacterized protein LOC143465258 isoform X2 [Clavelina lepadiformis]|uniref:uncharacterized protein LOC143465258 isoform X2 n=1 Tax=Clavelina lepadiformis TaxID=159417 RepID=UPI004042BBED